MRCNTASTAVMSHLCTKRVCHVCDVQTVEGSRYRADVPPLSKSGCQESCNTKTAGGVSTLTASTSVSGHNTADVASNSSCRHMVSVSVNSDSSLSHPQQQQQHHHHHHLLAKSANGSSRAAEQQQASEWVQGLPNKHLVQPACIVGLDPERQALFTAVVHDQHAADSLQGEPPCERRYDSLSWSCTRLTAGGCWRQVQV